jgi:predicted acylesterase/phospholipase RssA
MHRSENALRAGKILGGVKAAPGELELLAKALKTETNFGLARRLLEIRFDERDVQSSQVLKQEIGAKWSLCTYKDPDLPLDARLDEALRILSSIASLDTTENQEILGQAGAIHKRRWEAFTRKEDLERSLSFYLRGFDLGPDSPDPWYPGINAAFVLDLLAVQEASDEAGAGGKIPAVAQERVAKASAIRAQIADHFSKKPPGEAPEWWWFATPAEALFGLGKFSEAEKVLGDGVASNIASDWEKESTTRQLASLTRLRDKLPVPGQEAIGKALRAVSRLVDGSEAAVESAFRGRIGLALSGGGFRASLFHIGVLASLAERDLLRGIECLSCVSGGSIIGAHYYLHVRHLLQSKADGEITADDYIAIVRNVAEEFLAGVQRNIRTRVAAEWKTNLKMMFVGNYSRTLRVGELYESELFSRVGDGEGDRDRWLDQLTITPKGEAEGFNLKAHNWKRLAKVPNLILNATALNTGHTWQFTASWLGEPPAGINSEIDANYRLRRVYHEDVPPSQPKTRFGSAVAASSCVPGLFEPLPITGLYADRVLGLVDGGVHDNQGTGALLEQDCTVMLVSDASGQMDTQDIAPTGLLNVPLRANSILQARVREAQYGELAARRRAGLLSGLVFLHLKKDLDAETIDWIDCQDPSERPSRSPLTSYGVQKKVQRQLAAIRTDLDSFSDTEAYALMTSGYLMTNTALQSDPLGFSTPQASATNWNFLTARPLMQAATVNEGFFRRLKAAESISFKVWRLSRLMQLGAALLVLVIAVSLLAALWGSWPALAASKLTVEATVRGLIAAVLGIAAALLVLPPLIKRLRLPKTFQQFAIGLGMASAGFVFARLHLHVFDRWFLKDGAMRGGSTGITARAMKASQLIKSPAQSDGCIFINYRRNDSAASAGRLYDRLSKDFAPEQLFIDVDTIEPGVDFPKMIDKQVATCNAFIVVIGRSWLTVQDESGKPRLDNPEDFVRVEIESALKRDIRIIPVLVDGAIMPRSDQLPDTLKPLASRHAVILTHAGFGPEVARLVAVLKRSPNGLKKPANPTGSTGAGLARRSLVVLLGVVVVGFAVTATLIGAADQPRQAWCRATETLCGSSIQDPHSVESGLVYVESGGTRDNNSDECKDHKADVCIDPSRADRKLLPGKARFEVTERSGRAFVDGNPANSDPVGTSNIGWYVDTTRNNPSEICAIVYARTSACETKVFLRGKLRGEETDAK